MFSLEDAEATVETLLLMEFADLGTLDQTVTSGQLKGDMVRARFGLADTMPASAPAHPRGRQHAVLPLTRDAQTWSRNAGPRHVSRLALAAGIAGGLTTPVCTCLSCPAWPQ